MSNIMSFDIGGTFIKFGVIDSNGKILHEGKEITPKFNCRYTIPEFLVNKILDIRERFQIDGVGISTAGIVDSQKGEIIYASDNIKDYTGAKLAENIYDKTGLKCFVENDVDSAALGELWMGAATELDSFICITVGTGIGSSIVVNRKIYKGANGIAGWAGYMTINERENGCYEQYASTRGLVNKYICETGETSVDGIQILDRVKSQDPVATKVFHEFIEHVVTGLINLTYILDPGVILIGGGISAEELFIKKVNDAFKKRCAEVYAEKTAIKPTHLGNKAGLFGAVYTYLSKSNIINS